MKQCLFALFLSVLIFCGGVLYGQAHPVSNRVDYSKYNSDELSWMIEGIQERISELQDDLYRAQYAQRVILQREALG